MGKKKQKKQYFLSLDQIKPLSVRRGGCFVGDRISVDGRKVGYMSREEPDNDEDSGWQFFAGVESQEYSDNTENFAIFDVNTIANHDPDVILLLDAPVGSAFERDPESGRFPQEKFEPPEELHPDFPVVEGRYQMTKEWSVELPKRFSRRFEEGSLVLWRPRFTMWITVWGNDGNESRQERLSSIKSEVSPQAFDVIEEEKEGILWLAYRLDESAEDKRSPAFYSFAVGASGHVQLAIYFDDEHLVEMAGKIWRGLRETV
jgi:hypothetical protein